MFRVKGKPFYPLGGQANNSSAYNAEEIASSIAGLVRLGGNTLEAPVYWSQIEPEEGRFCFDAVDALLQECRKAGVKLVVLWFATWKNGEMRYAPEWVKTDRKRFRRVIRSDGTQMQVLSSYCTASMQADAAAFARLMAYLKQTDTDETVIAVQVENEPGILGSDRDYSLEAAAALKEQVPGELVAAIRAKAQGPVWDAWKACGAPARGSWEKLFGIYAPEFREARSIAAYIDAVAAAGKAEHDIPLYVNVWLGEQGWGIPGGYPAGGAVGRVLDIWKATAKHIDLIAPDIYISNFNDYKSICGIYDRADNPLFVPESGANDSNALNMMRAIADYNAIGYACFAIDSVLDDAGELRPECQLFAESFRCVKNVLPLIRKFHGTGRIHAVVQEEHQPSQRFEFERFIGLADFSKGMTAFHLDHRHSSSPGLIEGRPCYGLIIEAAPGEFYLSGNFRLYLVQKRSPQWNMALLAPVAFSPDDHLTVEEGVLDEDGNFTPTRERNGDEASWASFWATPYSGVVRVRLNIEE